MLNPTHAPNDGAKAKKKPTLLLGVALGIVLVIGGIVLALLIAPLDGKYSGRILDSLSGDAVFVLKHGDAFIGGPDGELIPYGHYSKTQVGWRLIETGNTNDWVIDRNLRGFDLISSTNGGVRYRFTKR